MRVLFVTNSIGMGGASVALIHILSYLKKHGIQALVTSPEYGDFTKELDILGIPAQVIGNPLEIYPKLSTWKSYIKYPYNLLWMLFKSLSAYIKLCQCIKDYKPDIIHTNVGPVQIGYLAAHKYCIPHVWHIREYQKEDFGMRPFPSMKIFLKRIHSQDNHCICITKDIFKHFKLSTIKDKVIYDGVIDKTTLAPFNRKKKNYILFAGRLEDAKGVKELIKAYNIYAEYGGKLDLYIAGNGSQKYISACNSLIGLTLKDRVHFLGSRSHSDVFRLMYEAFLFVVPSRSEGFGFITAEAMFNGTIVIGRNTGGTKEQFDNAKELSEEEIGIRYINENQLPVILKRYENIDVEEYERTATKAQEIVCKLYDIDTQTKILYDFLVDLYLRTRI